MIDIAMFFSCVSHLFSRLGVFFIALLATFNFIYVATSSFIRYLVHGPRVSSWDFPTHFSCELFQYIFTHTNTSIIYRSSIKYWAIILKSAKELAFGDRYPCTVSFVQIPAVVVSADIARSAGRWEDKLLHMSSDSVLLGDTISANCISHASINIPQNKHTGKVILYFHGGAYVMGSLRSYHGLHMRLATATKLPIYSVEYRLAPQFKYPTQLYDAYCAYFYLRQDLGYKACDIVVAGDSAGGSLALALWQLIRAHDESIAALILLSPLVDILNTRDTWRTNSDIDYLKPERIDDIESFACKLLGSRDLANTGPSDIASYMKGFANDPFVAPINADLSELPPTLIQAGEKETMYFDICEFVARAAESVQQRRSKDKTSGSVEFQTLPDGVHVFQMATPEMRGVAKFWHNMSSFIESLD